jgi:polyhydroxyalkanoate synthase
VFAGNTDGIAPIPAVRALLPLLKNAREVRFEIVPGGHLGMLTGRAARHTTWVVMDEWIARYSTPDDREETTTSTARRAAKNTARKAATKKAPTKKAPQKRATKKSSASTTSRGPAKTTAPPAADQPIRATDVAPDRGAIGSNPERRFTSRGSRSLAPKR